MVRRHLAPTAASPGYAPLRRTLVLVALPILAACGGDGATVPAVCTVPENVSLTAGQRFVGTPDCSLFLPSGNAGDRYRVAIVRMTAEQDAAATQASLTLIPQGIVAAQAAGAPVPVLPGLFDERQMAVLEASHRISRTTARIHARLREAENELLLQVGAPTLSLPPAPAPAGPLPVAPAKRSFRVRAPSDASCMANSATLVTGLLVLESIEIVVYQDSAQAQSQPLSQAHVQRMLDFFGDYGKATVETYFGSIPDRDGNGQVVVFVTPKVSGNVAGFVWGGDLLDRSACAASNEMELVYFNGGLIHQLGNAPPNYQALETLVHEVKHVVSFFQRLSGTLFNLHPSWMEEGAAEVAGEIASRVAWAAKGGPEQNAVVTRQSFMTSGSDFTPENYGVALRLFRTATYLSSQPNAVVIAPQGGKHSIYDSGWHFFRFLGDAYGSAASASGADASFFRQQTGNGTPPGLSGLEVLTGKTFEELLLEFAAAVMLNGTLAPAPSRAFTTYDFPSATTVFKKDIPKAPYPYPVTAHEISPDVWTPSTSLGSDTTWSGPIGNAGLRIHDFVSNGTGSGAHIIVQADPPTRVVVVRLR